jgi:hypothetical protein
MKGAKVKARRLGLFVVLLGTVAVVGGLLAATGEGSSGLDKLSTPGVPVKLSPDGAASIVPLEVTGVYTLRTTRDRAYFRITRNGGTACYASGLVGITGAHPTFVICPTLFPSAAEPVLASPLVDVDKRSGARTLERIDGFVADGVHQIEFVNKQGTVVGRADVHGNTFEMANIGSNLDAGTLIARDVNGAVVYDHKYGTFGQK